MTDSATLTDHDLLIRIDERVRAIHERLQSTDRWVAGHEKSHGRTMKVLGGVAATLGSIAGAIVAFFTK